MEYDRKKYDVVMFSFETSSAHSAYKHCAEFRKRGVYTVCGGYHATALPEEAAEHFDTVISGPAERSVPQFVRDYLNGSPQKLYRDFSVCAEDFTIPARDKITRRKKLKIPAVVANRGCPNCCKYCSMGMMWKSCPRSVGSVIEEIAQLKTRMLIFYDPNFFGDRSYAMELMSALKPMKILWAANATADFGYDDELMRAAYESGCRGVLIGLESLNPQSLTNASKRFHDADKYKEIIENIHKHGIAVNGCFVMCFDDDTEEQLLALPERVDRLGLDLCRFSVLTPYPGTKLYEELDRAGRIMTKDWSRYNQHNTVFSPKGMSSQRLDEIYRRVWKEAYSWKRVFRRTFHSVWRWKPYVFVLLGANIGFKFLGIDKGAGK